VQNTVEERECRPGSRAHIRYATLRPPIGVALIDPRAFGLRVAARPVPGGSSMTRSGVWRASMTASSCDGSLSAVKYRSTSLTDGGPKLGGCIPKSAPSTPSSFTRSACDRAPALKSGRSDRRTECGEPGSDTVERTGNQNPRLFACAPSDLGRSALRPSPYPISLWLRLADNGRRSAGPEAARIDPRFELSVFASRLNLRCRGAAGLLVGNLDE